MRYPNFISENSLIGICAPSAGVGGKLDDYLKSLAVLNSQGYRIIETKSVRSDNQRSTSSKSRAKELLELFENKDVDFIMCATGGDFMMEILPYVDFKLIKENPKWIMGYSDPTNILFPITTKLDIATLYGYNGGSYEDAQLKPDKINLEFLKGNLVKQNSYKKYIECVDLYNGVNKLDKKVKWLSKKNFEAQGRCIGGCFEAIQMLIGSDYLDVKGFIERYKEDGIIWYFDVFSSSSCNFYWGLNQMKNAGFFKYCKAVLFGRVAFPKEDDNITYLEAMNKVLGKIPYICEMDIGHTNPRMTMINGAIIKVKYQDHKGSLKFELK